MLRIVRLFFYLVILILGLGFAVRNAQLVNLDYYFGIWRISLSLALVAVMAFGALLGVLACTGMLMRLKNEVYTLRRSAKTSEQELVNLRAIPLKGMDSA